MIYIIMQHKKKKYNQQQMRRRSGANFDQLLNRQFGTVTRAQYQQIQNMFKKIQQKNGGISFYDMINILKNNGFNITQEKRDQINRQLTNKQIRIIDLNVVVSQVAALKKQKNQSGKHQISQQNQYLDAFVALGGNPDKSGQVKKSAIETVKKQFQLTFDIQSLVDSVGDSLDYTAFKSIFQQQKQKGQGGRLTSAASQRSLKSSDSARSLVLDQKDFQRFLAQYDGQDPYN